MAKYLPLPDGSAVPVPDDMSYDEAIEKARKQYPDAFKVGRGIEEPTVGGQVKEFFKGLAPGAIGLVESAATGASALLPEETEKSAREGIARIAQAAKEPFAATPGYEETVGRKFGQAAGSIAPFLATGPFGLAGRAAGFGLGVGAGAGEARTRAEQEGATAGQRSLSTGLGSVVGLSEMFAPLRILGRIDEPVKQGVVAGLKRVAMAGGEEALQEASAQAAQNLIAKGVYKPEQEIIEQVGESAAYGGAVGALAQGLMDLALGRRVKGTGTPDEIAAARAEAETARAEELAKKSSPEYAQQFVADYKAKEQEYIQARKDLKKPDKDAPPSVWEEYNRQKKTLNAMRQALADDAAEYNKLKPLVARAAPQPSVEEEPVTAPAAQAPQPVVPPATPVVPAVPAAESTFDKTIDYDLQAQELTNRIAELQTQQRTATDVNQLLDITNQLNQANENLKAAQANAALARAPSEEERLRAQLTTAVKNNKDGSKNKEILRIANRLKELGVADIELKTAKDKAQEQIARAKAAATTYQPGAPDIEAQEQETLAEAERQRQASTVEAEQEKQLATEINALRRIGARPAGLTNITAGLNTQPTPTEPQGSAAMAMMNQRLRLEADLTAAREALVKARSAFDGTPYTQDALTRAENNLAAAQKRYDEARADMLQGELIPTAEEEKTPEETTRKIQRAPSTGFKLFPRQGAPERPSDYQNLATRLASALARNDIDQTTYDFLRRAERVLPTIDQRIETARQTRTTTGAASDVASTEGFLTLLDQQLDLIERNQEGVLTGQRFVETERKRAPGAQAELAPATTASGEDIKSYSEMETGSAAAVASKRRVTGKTAAFDEETGAPVFTSGLRLPEKGESQRVSFPGAPVTERTKATTGRTLRMPAKPLSLAGEMEPLLRLQEQLAGPDLAESTQGELFKDDTTGVVRSTPANFRRFLQSKEVQALRAALPKTAADIKRQQQAIPALQKRVDELKKRVEEMDKAAQKYKTAQAVLKANKDLANLQRGIEDIQRTITARVVDRLNLEKQISDIGFELGRLEGARAAFIAPDKIVVKNKTKGTKIGVGAPQLMEMAAEYRGEELSTDLLEIENRVQALRAEMDALLSARIELDSGLNELNRYVQVVEARNKITELQERAPFGYEMDQAKEQLRAAQANLADAQQKAGTAQAELIAKQGQERRQQEAIAQARRIDDSNERAKEEQKRLEAMYSKEAEGQQVFADPLVQARQLAQTLGEPQYTEAEKRQLVNEPEKVLAGYRSRIKTIEKQITNARQTSLAARDNELNPLRAKVEGLEQAYKAAPSADARAALLPQIEEATKALQVGVEKQAVEPLTWKGMAGQIRALAAVTNKADVLEEQLKTGVVVPKEAQPTRTALRVESAVKKAEATAEREKEESEEAAKRAGAPTTSGEALTRTEAKKAGEAKKTVYTGKGVGGGAVFRTAVKAGPSLKEQNVRDIADKVIADWQITPEIEVVSDIAGLPENLRKQAEATLAYLKQDAFPGMYDTETKKVYLVASGLKDANDVILTLAHEITGHFGLREMLGGAYAPTMTRLYDGNKLVRERADAKLAENPALSKNVAVEEVLADMAENGATPQERNIVQRLIDAFKRWFARKFPDFNIDTITDNEVKQVVANARRYVIEGETGAVQGGTAASDGLVYRTAKYVSPEMEAAGKALDPFVTKHKNSWEKIKANSSGLAFETQLVDRFAGFERLRKYMPEVAGTQMMYYLRMYDQRMNFVSQAVGHGALTITKKTREDGKVERIVEAKEGPSIKGTVEILKAATPMVGNSEAVNRLFTAYMAAIRADTHGFHTLNFGEDVTPAMLKDALKVVENNDALKNIFDKARSEYNAYNRNMMAFLAETGAISESMAKRLTAENDYIPFYRERNGVAQLLIGQENPINIGSVAEQPYLKELVGGEQPILDFLTSSVQNTNMLVDMGMRNLATKNAVYELFNLNAAKFIKGRTAGNDVVRYKENGEDRYAVIATEKVKIGDKTFDTGVPADILVKGMEGIPTQMPFIFRAMAMPAQLLRKGVTLSPLYMGKQLFRDSLAAPILAGANFTPVLGALREINKGTKNILERRGVTGGQQFHGTAADLSMIMRETVDGKTGWMKALSWLEAKSMASDALTRRAQYNSYIKQGMSEMEATLMALESMNFSKRGASPSVHVANALIPFFNAQIQGLNVLYKAMRGKMPFNEKLKIQQKLLVRGGMMATASLVYAMMMQDDDAYKNARPDEKYGNWFVRIPGIDEPLKVPVPFEIGYIFKALPEAMLNSMMDKHGSEEAVKAFRQILIQTLPGGSSMPQIGGVPVPLPIPQALKPAIEAGLGKSFYTGRDILSAREKDLLPEEQFRANTTDIAKAFGKLTGTSPIIAEQLVRGYTGTMGLAFLQALSLGVPTGETPEKAFKRLSEYPVIGGAFQPNDAGGIVNSVYERMNEAEKVGKTFKAMIADGRVEDARELINRRTSEFLQSEVASDFKQNMQQLTALERAVRVSNMSGADKRTKLDEIQRMRTALAKAHREVADKMVSVSSSL